MMNYSLFTLQNNASKPIVLKVSLNGVPTNMELDTGASTSVLSEATYKLLLEQEKVAVLEPSAVQLKTYTGQLIGTIAVKAEYMGEAADVRIQVAKGMAQTYWGETGWNHFLLTLPGQYTMFIQAACCRKY